VTTSSIGRARSLDASPSFRRSPPAIRALALTQKLRRIVDESVGYGLALEGISAADVARSRK